jgi:hypothetical protein
MIAATPMSSEFEVEFHEIVASLAEAGITI